MIEYEIRIRIWRPNDVTHQDLANDALSCFGGQDNTVSVHVIEIGAEYYWPKKGETK